VAPMSLASTVLAALQRPQVPERTFVAPTRPNTALRASSATPEARTALAAVRAEFERIYPGVTPSVGALRVFAVRRLARAKRRALKADWDFCDGITDDELAEIEEETA
jgi:hypothetical protein